MLSSGAAMAWITQAGHRLLCEYLTVVSKIKCLSLTTLRNFLGVITQSSEFYNPRFSGNSRKKKEKPTTPHCPGDPCASLCLSGTGPPATFCSCTYLASSPTFLTVSLLLSRYLMRIH